MSFMAVMDFTSSEHADASSYLPLRVKKDIDSNPDMDITVTKLNKNGNDSFNHFFSNGYSGITAKFQILLKETDMWNNKKVLEVIDGWYKNMTPLDIVTDALNIPPGQYIISKNDSRNQTYKGSTVWEIEIKTYTPLVLHKFKNDNSNVLKALKKNKAKKNSSKKKKNSGLAKCNYKSLVYSKKKKNVKCVKTMQQVLYKKKYLNKKYVTGWYHDNTRNAVRKFQKDYNTKRRRKYVLKAINNIIWSKAKVKTAKLLPENGKVDKATFNALCKL